MCGIPRHRGGGLRAESEITQCLMKLIIISVPKVFTNYNRGNPSYKHRRADNLILPKLWLLLEMGSRSIF